MKKKYLVGLSIAALCIMMVSLILILSTARLPHKIPYAKAEKRISEVQNGPDLVKKELLLNNYKKHLAFEEQLRKRDLAYAELVWIVSVAIIFISLIQLVLLYRLHKQTMNEKK